MKVYVASSFSLIPKVKKITKILEKRGHEISEKWWNRVYSSEGLGLVDTQKLKKIFDDLPPDEFYSKIETRKSYLLDLKGITEAEAFIFVANDKPRKFTGANIELGYALAKGIRCLSIGNLTNSVLYFEVIRCKNIQEILYWLSDLEGL
jgi:hypothetical protein